MSKLHLALALTATMLGIGVECRPRYRRKEPSYERHP